MFKKSAKARRLLSVVMIVIMILQILVTGVSVQASDTVKDAIGSVDYTIRNPYKDVDWGTWGAYRGATHVHSHMSDGDKDFNEMIEHYYGLGYDCVSMTDHGTVNYGWTAKKDRHSWFNYSYILHGDVHALSSQRNLEITTGVGRNGRGMIDVPYGIELNGASVNKCHINSYFASCGDGDLAMDETWPESAVAKAQSADAICHINHIGEWSGGNDDIGVYTESFISKLADVYRRYSACVGMELVNTADSRTKNDRYLYDELLKILAPEGVTVWGFCEDDSHEYSDCGRNAQFFMMPSNTAQNVRTSMETGAFFACSQNAKNANELGSGFGASGDFPMVDEISINEEKDQITITCHGGNKIRMVSGGTVLETGVISESGDSYTFDLNAYEDNIESYVRMYITGPGGICYIQPFYLKSTPYNAQSTVEMILPSTDTTVTVFDADGNEVAPYNDDNYYVLPAGTYTYNAERDGFLPVENVEFTVTQEEIDQKLQKKIEVVLEPDSGIVRTYFYVPEVIYLDTADLTSFKYYADRENYYNGKLNSEIRTVGNACFSCDKATDINITIESMDPDNPLGEINFDVQSRDESYIITSVVSGKMSKAMGSNTGLTLKWTATYKVNGVQYVSYAYSYVYSPLVGNSSTAAAGGGAGTDKDWKWLHTSMHVSGMTYVSGVHSVTGGSGSYLCSPYAPQSSLARAQKPESLLTGGVGASAGYTSEDGESASLDITGGTATLYVDTSRYTNFSQIPNFTVGLHLLSSSSCEESAEQSLRFGTAKLYSLTTRADKLANPSVLYYTDNTDSSRKLNYALNKNTTSVSVIGQISGKKSDCTDTVYCRVNLNVNCVDKGYLRDVYNTACEYARQSFWYADQTAYNEYCSALENVGILLGKLTATEAEVSAAAERLVKATANLEAGKSTYTVNHYIDSADGIFLESNSGEYEYGKKLRADALELRGYTLIGWDRYENSTVAESSTEDSDEIVGFGPEYEWRFYYKRNSYNVRFENGGIELIPITGSGKTAVYDEEYVLPSSIPDKIGYRFGGWVCSQTGDVYDSGEKIIWNYDEDVTFFINWVEAEYEISYDLNGGDENYEGEFQTKATYMGDFALPLINPTRDGYSFAGWLLDVDSKTYVGGTSTVWDHDCDGKFTAQWAADGATYTVHYFFQNLAGTAFVENKNITLTQTGDVYNEVFAPTPDFEGFTFDKSRGNLSGILTKDEELVLNVYYTRETNNLTVTYDICGNASATFITSFGSDVKINQSISVDLLYESKLTGITTYCGNSSLKFCGWWGRYDDGTEKFISPNANHFVNNVEYMPGEDFEIIAVYATEKATVFGGAGYAKNNTGADLTEGVIIIPETGMPDVTKYMYSNPDAEYSFEYISTVNGNGSGSFVQVLKNSVVTETHMLIILGDSTGDSYADGFDLAECISYCNMESSADFSDTVKTMSLDMNSDGYIDAFDLAVLNMVSNFE